MPAITPQTARKEFMRHFMAASVEQQAGTIESLQLLHEVKLAERLAKPTAEVSDAPLKVETPA